ncbi:MAG: signal peptidase I [Aggregatilineales bacterium]
METTKLPRPHFNRGPLRVIRELAGTLIFGVAVFVFFQLAIPQSMVQGSSMEPTFQDGQRLFISRVNYMINEPERGEIIVFNSPSPREENEAPLIKRVIGIPGDVIEIIDSMVYLNGTMLDEPYINEPCRSNCRDNRWELGPNDYFMMGDNRNHSNDSRSFGVVPSDHIIGEVVLRFWPPQDFKLFHSTLPD